MTKVYVVMGNDYPDAVFSLEEEANKYCKKKEAENISGQKRIYWRVYDFTVDQKPAS